MKHLRYNIKAALKPSAKNIISVLSLALGLTLILVLFGNLMFEKSYDNFHKNSDRLYNVNCWYITNESTGYGDKVPDIVIPTLKQEIPEIELATYFRQNVNHQESN